MWKHKSIPPRANSYRLGVSPALVATELRKMAEVAVATSAGRSRLGSLSKFPYLLSKHDVRSEPLIDLSLALVNVPCGPIRHGPTMDAAVRLFFRTRFCRRGSEQFQHSAAVLTTLSRSLPKRVLNRLALAHQSQQPCCVRTRTATGVRGNRGGSALPLPRRLQALVAWRFMALSLF